MCDGDIIENQSEPFGPLYKLIPHGGTQRLPVCNEFPGVELGHYGLEDFIGDAGENPFVIVHTQGGVNAGQTIGAGPKKRKKRYNNITRL